MIIAIVPKDLGSTNSSRRGTFMVFIFSLLGFGLVLVFRLQIKQEIYQLTVSYRSYRHLTGSEALFADDLPIFVLMK
jgi:hypothetical protein